MSDRASALVYVAPGVAEIREVDLPPLGDGMIEIETGCSALSRGTERLVFEGRVPESEWARMRAPFQEGSFPFPVRYGYAAVGTVVAGDPKLAGHAVFCLHPHQTRFRVAKSAALKVPGNVPAERAVLAANAETALNAIWDADLAPGARVLIVGAGLLGCLIATLLSRRSDLRVATTDVIGERRRQLSPLPVTFCAPHEVEGPFDVCFHTSASADGLALALDALDVEGRVIELSWYGDRQVPVPLGRTFHSRRLSIICSQVGLVARSRRSTITHCDRLAQALALLDDPRIDAFVTAEVRFADLPAALPHLLGPEADGIATRVVFD